MRRTPDFDDPSSVPPHEGTPEVTLFKVPGPLPQDGSGGLDDQRDRDADRGEFTGGINDFASEAANVGGVGGGHSPAATTRTTSAADERVSDELLPSTGFVIANDVTERPLRVEENASEEHALDAFPSKSARASAPWRSPEEMFPVDDPLNPSDNDAASWDLAPVYPPAHTGMSATDSKMSIAGTEVQPSGRRWFGSVAMAFLLFAVAISMLPADGPGLNSAVTSEPATKASARPSLDPASSDPVEKVAGTAGVGPGPGDPGGTPEPLPSSESSAAVNGLAARDNTLSIPGSLSAADWLARGGRQSALPSQPSSPTAPAGSNAASRPLSTDRPADIGAAKRETGLASTVASGNRSDTTDVVPSPTAPAPLRNDATMAPPPAADTVARTDAASTPAVAPSSETTDRTLPPTMTGEGTAPVVSPAAPAIPPAVTTDGAGTAGEAAAIDAITATLRRLQLAYEHRDATLAKAVWPTVNERALARAFDGLRSQSVIFDSCWMNVFSVSADVECRGVTTYVPRVGGQYQRTESRQWTFRVEKGDDHWLITSAEAR